jgi:Zn ribbon nucleic-acid-binding protein
MPMVKTIIAANLKLIESEGVLCPNCQDTGLVELWDDDYKQIMVVKCLYCGPIESDPTNNVLEYLKLREKAESMVW